MNFVVKKQNLLSEYVSKLPGLVECGFAMYMHSYFICIFQSTCFINRAVASTQIYLLDFSIFYHRVKYTQFSACWKSRPIVFVCLQLGAFWCFFIFDPRPYKLVGHQFIPLICVFISLSIKEKLAVQAGETGGTLFWQMHFFALPGKTVIYSEPSGCHKLSNSDK